LRFRDPRRFGLLLWTTADADRHPLISHLVMISTVPISMSGRADDAWL
jgi:hypothetical protein